MPGNEASKSWVPWPGCGCHWNSQEKLNHPHVSARALWSGAWSEEVDSHEKPVSKRETFPPKPVVVIRFKEFLQASDI